MYSHTASFTSQQSDAGEACRGVQSTDSDSSLLRSPLHETPPLAATVSFHTRSKVKILDPIEAQISLKLSSSNPTSKDPELITLNSSEDGEEIDSHSHKSPKDDSELFPDVFEPLPFDDVVMTEALSQETEPLGETAENEPSKPDSFIPSCEKLKSLMNSNKLENLLRTCSLDVG